MMTNEEFYYSKMPPELDPENPQYKPQPAADKMAELRIEPETLYRYLDIPQTLAARFLMDPPGRPYAFASLTAGQAERLNEFVSLFDGDQFSENADMDDWVRYVIKQVILINGIPFGAVVKLAGVEDKALARYLNVKSHAPEDIAEANSALSDAEKLRLNHLGWRFYFTLNRYQPATTIVHHLDGLKLKDDTDVKDAVTGVVLKESLRLTEKYDDARAAKYGGKLKPYNYRLGFELIADEWE
jgi:hypothetical protein